MELIREVRNRGEIRGGRGGDGDDRGDFERAGRDLHYDAVGADERGVTIGFKLDDHEVLVTDYDIGAPHVDCDRSTGQRHSLRRFSEALVPGDRYYQEHGQERAARSGARLPPPSRVQNTISVLIRRKLFSSRTVDA